MNNLKYIWRVAAILAGIACGGCSDIGTEESYSGKGIPLSVVLSLEDHVDASATRTVSDVDGWMISSFDIGDMGGIYATGGIQDPDNPSDFTQSSVNGKVYCQSKSGSTYRFGNSDIVIDPTTLADYKSIIYYPYYEDMPDPMATDGIGMSIRQTDTSDPEDNRREKCVDFMYTSTSTSSTPNNITNINVSNGQMTPKFFHYFSSLVIKRGSGFTEAPDKRVWVVTKTPYTDIRVTRASETAYFAPQLQYNPEGTEDERMVYITDRATGEQLTKFKVDRDCLWETWPGQTDATRDSRYVMIPPGEVYFILIQDNYGTWQNVTDFYLASSGSRSASVATRYNITISIKGLDVIGRPISVSEWNEEENITDDRKKGIADYVEFNNWVSLYNSYNEHGRDAGYEEELQTYGDAVHNTVTGQTIWTFYINADIKFSNTEYSQIKVLADTLEGSSTYTNYKIENLRETLIEEVSETGVLKALEFNDLYLIQPTDKTEPYSPLIGTLNGGTVENCNVLNSIIISRNPAGIIAGKAIGGTVTGCVLSGDVIGSSAPVGYEGIFGEVTGQPIVTGNNTSGLKFLQN